MFLYAACIIERHINSYVAMADFKLKIYAC
ncbi:hypothetical protein GS393_05408 [Pseudomonas savastanoi pv. phaseolicola]|nr:hypothetical protein [Pseudomonas savastanoi pv. phaseolicola]